MITIGTDIVCVDRFKKWKSYSYDQLRRVFAKQEIDYCRDDMSCLAVRFAAKEAFFKALSAMLVKLGLTKHEFTFLFLCQHIYVDKTTWDVPVFVVDWQKIGKKIQAELPELQVELSISHERKYAIACVIIQSPVFAP